MTKILELNVEDMDVTVQPGLSFVALNKQLEKYKLFFPLDAGPAASIGGMVSTSASGIRAFRYGTIKDSVLSLRVVMADGTIVRTGSRARKSSAGYDLTHLFCGAEGTLGIITEVSLRLRRVPEQQRAALVQFPSMAACARVAMALSQLDHALQMVEFLDAPMIKAVNIFNKFDYAERDTMYFELAGSARQVAEQKFRRNFHSGIYT